VPILFAIAVAFGVGMVSGIFGVGGGFILVPVLSVLGIEMNFAVGSAACYVLGPATTALLHRETKLEAWRLPLIFTGGIFVGVLLGSSILSSLSASTASGENTVDYVVLGTYLVLLSALGGFAVFESFRAAAYRPLPRGWIANWMIPPVVSLSEWDDRRMSITVLAMFGLAVGFLSGLLGISGGLLILPGLIYLFRLPSQKSVVCSMVLVWLVSFQSTIAHAWQGNIRLDLVAALLAGGTIGARFGTSIGKRLGSQELRKSFGYLSLATAVFVAIRLVILTRS